MVDLNDPRHFDTPLFPISVGADVTAVELGTMRVRSQRHHSLLFGTDPEFGQAAVKPERAGMPALLTYRAILTLAAAEPLVKKGVTFPDAFRAAQRWTYLGETWSGVGPSPRDPAQLFSGVRTLLVHYIGSDAKVIRYDLSRLDYGLLFGTYAPPFLAPTLVDLNRLDRHARTICEKYLAQQGRG